MNRPFIYVNMAMTVDGKITSTSREEPQFTSRHDRKTMDKLRAQADAVLVGAGTLRADDPPSAGPRRRDAAAARVAGETGASDHGAGHRQRRHRSRLQVFSPPAGEGTRIVATVEDAPPDRLERLRQRAEVWTLGAARSICARCAAVSPSAASRGLLVEGGGDLNWGFVSDDLVDEIYVTIAPALMGGRNAPTLLEGDGFAMSDRRRLRLVDVDRVGDELFTRWAMSRGES
jgi:2,5-diamino-6-(ribosylamino)-4(3H)-pyrimidinone 5'-phosphate reductase